ncbi:MULTISPECIES: hypothetical protein [unclassified Brevibacterium]|uniref:hypothetical protein n=1 Tax=unclassified Brevibacterium TaxID=2614124 RepID=UPI0010F6AC92|nr:MULTISPECIES: hypothetical protein [unclassified Brevibacterium]MCM1011269.1 hypothetical protein [Brevibacterium sp. XM4083]
MKKLFSFRRRRADGPDEQFGTGLWRHNHDRFLRAVDRYYTTALAIHTAAPTDAAGEGSTPTTAAERSTHDPGTTAPEPAAASARDAIMAGTHRLNDLATEIDEITAWLHTHCPVDGQVVPGPARRVVGDTPELLTRASSKVAEAVLAASMARAGTATLTSTATATDRYITDAAELLAQVRRTLAEADAR